MASRIEDYGIIGDTETVALVDLSGSVDWWCAPRIDSGACFAALLGGPEHGRWLICAEGDVTERRRRYIEETLILETEITTTTGTVAVIDFMPPRADHPTIFRLVEGRAGTVDMRLELVVRFDYGSMIPWVQATGDGQVLVAGEDGLRFHSPIPVDGRDFTTTATFTVAAGQRLSFSLVWFPSHVDPPLPYDGLAAFHRTRSWWTNWVQRCTYAGNWRDDVVRSLITLKALTYAPTGAITAAATTSLPEQLGGVRNWDYRFSWLRDATFTLQTLIIAGYIDEARSWVRWLRRAVAGHPAEFQIMYGVRGERRLTELELDWLSGYEGSAPVRVGNAASEQFQLDVFGEVMDAALVAVRAGLEWQAGFGDEIARALLEHLEEVWREPDEGIWEVRGPRRHFTHSKVMAWVAFDRAVRIGELRDLDGDHFERWRAIRDEIHREVCEHGWNAERGSFVQSYGSTALDASLLKLCPVGFLPPTDKRIVSTVEAIQRELVVDGFVRRYQTDAGGDVDGLPEGEGAFLMTSFWLVDNLALLGRFEEAVAMFERLRAVHNELGLFAEEYDPALGRMLGNFPQAFSHVSFVNTAANLSLAEAGPAVKRPDLDP